MIQDLAALVYNTKPLSSPSTLDLAGYSKTYTKEQYPSNGEKASFKSNFELEKQRLEEAQEPSRSTNLEPGEFEDSTKVNGTGTNEAKELKTKETKSVEEETPPAQDTSPTDEAELVRQEAEQGSKLERRRDPKKLRGDNNKKHDLRVGRRAKLAKAKKPAAEIGEAKSRGAEPQVTHAAKDGNLAVDPANKKLDAKPIRTELGLVKTENKEKIKAKSKDAATEDSKEGLKTTGIEEQSLVNENAAQLRTGEELSLAGKEGSVRLGPQEQQQTKLREESSNINIDIVDARDTLAASKSSSSSSSSSSSRDNSRNKERRGLRAGVANKISNGPPDKNSVNSNKNIQFTANLDNRIYDTSNDSTKKTNLRTAIENAFNRLNNGTGTASIQNMQIKMFNNNRSEINLQLNPAHLGKVKIRLSLEEGIIQGQIIVDNQGAAKTMEQSLANLNQGFAESGYQKSELGVSVDLGRGADSNGEEEELQETQYAKQQKENQEKLRLFDQELSTIDYIV